MIGNPQHLPSIIMNDNPVCMYKYYNNVFLYYILKFYKNKKIQKL